MATLPLPAAILDDLICGTGNEVIQDGGRKRKGRHFSTTTTMGIEKAALYYYGHKIMFRHMTDVKWVSIYSCCFFVVVILTQIGFNSFWSGDTIWYRRPYGCLTLLAELPKWVFDVSYFHRWRKHSLFFSVDNVRNEIMAPSSETCTVDGSLRMHHQWIYHLTKTHLGSFETPRWVYVGPGHV